MTYFGLADPYGFLQCGCGAFCSLAASEIYFEWGLFLELADPFRFTLSGWFQYSAKLADDEIGFFDLLENIPVHRSKLLVEESLGDSSVIFPLSPLEKGCFRGVRV